MDPVRTVAGKATAESQSLFQTILEKAPGVIGAIIALVIFWILGALLKKFMLRKLAEHNTDDQTAMLIAKISHVIMIVIGITIGLKMIGIDIVALVGLFGLGIGVGVQDVLKNFLAGIMIIIQQPFKVGDLIQVKEYMGIVESIENRATFIRTLDGQRVIIPNGDVYNNSVTNFSAHPERRIVILVGVEYESDLAVAAETVLKALQKNTLVLKYPEPRVFFEEFGDSSISLSARFWVDIQQNYFEIKSVIIQEIKHALDEVGISIPFPIRTLKIDREQEINVLLNQASKEKTPEKPTSPPSV